MVRLLLAALPFPRAMRLLRLRIGAERERAGTVDAAVVLTVARAVGRAARGLPIGAVCLQQATTTALMLRRRGLPAEVSFGVRKRDGTVEAHAWTHCGAIPVSGVEQAKDFAPIAVFQA